MKLWQKIVVGVVMVAVIAIVAAPMPRFDKPCSTVVEASDGTLLGARIADDGQWRFPAPDSLPDKYVAALLNFEDRWFYRHPGVNPVSLFNALISNVKAGSIVRGGSTITMQVARLSRDNPPRTYRSKIVEILSALKLELFKSKDQILVMYAANAPFGGNTVGLESAVWRYTGRDASFLTWAEAAALAVLPNSPSAVNPGNNTERFKEKRDNLLKTLHERGYFDEITLDLSLSEPLLHTALPMPSSASHLTDYFHATLRGERVRTTIDSRLQQETVELVNSHQKVLADNMINNAAAIVVRVSDGAVLAYVGNSSLPDSTGVANRSVDIIRSSRSTGSILKPFLYGGMLTAGDILPNQLVADIPTRFEHFRPQNADFTYSGAVKAGDALARSLNIPAVKMLQQYTTERFLSLLHEVGFTTFTRTADDYGLSLILGGGEARLYELAGVYASMARSLITYNEIEKYDMLDWHLPVFFGDGGGSVEKIKNADNENDAQMVLTEYPTLSAAAIWFTYEALRKVNRPETETGWQYFGSIPNLAWKTGTSYGSRDAWAIGTTPYAVTAVWAGNASGEGRPGLSGTGTAAPLMFDIIRLLPETGWFEQPFSDMTVVDICNESGFRAGTDCDSTREEWIPVAGLKSDACPYHKIVHLDLSERYRVNLSCVEPEKMVTRSWFVLPPAMEFYYRQRNTSYRPLPPFLDGCTDDKREEAMEFIYPAPNTTVYFPKDFSGNVMSMLPEVAHRRRNAILYWHIDNTFIGTTKSIHQIEIYASKGSHVLTVTDDQGYTITRRFVVR